MDGNMHIMVIIGYKPYTLVRTQTERETDRGREREGVRELLFEHMTYPVGLCKVITRLYHMFIFAILFFLILRRT